MILFTVQIDMIQLFDVLTTISCDKLIMKKLRSNIKWNYAAHELIDWKLTIE